MDLNDDDKDKMLATMDPMNEVELIDLAHALSMRNDGTMAACGRLLKAVGPAWRQFMHDEITNNHNANDGIGGMVKSFALLTGMALAMTRDGPKNLNNDEYLKMVGEAFARELPRVNRLDAQGKPVPEPVRGDGFVMVNRDIMEC